MITVTCKCGQTLRAEDGLAGKQVTCVLCGESLLIPLTGPDGNGAVRQGDDREGPTIDMLAGLYVYLEGEEDLTIRPRQAPGSPAPAALPGEEQPTPDELAGIYVCVEGEENVGLPDK
jgi:hypothetical protein